MRRSRARQIKFTVPLAIEKGVITPGNSCLKVHYKGIDFVGDLLSNGDVRDRVSQKTFQSLTSWSMFCKRQITESKASDDGWKSVMYKGVLFDKLRTKYLLSGQ